MNRNTDIVLNALKRRADDRGYIRTSNVELAADTALSRATVQRLIDRLIEDGQIEKRSKRGQSGGLLIRLTNASQTPQRNASQTPQNEPVRNVFTQGEGPKGPNPPAATENASRNASTAYRQVAPHETTESGAEFIYTGPDENGQWRQLSKTLWLAPNGDAVSTKNMTPELKVRLRVEPE